MPRKSYAERYLENAEREQRAFPKAPEFTEAVRELVTAVNGFPYAGDRLEAICDAIKWLRTNPEKAAFILGDFNA